MWRTPGQRPSSVHPHIRGVFFFCSMKCPPVIGPSPHTWGFLRRIADFRDNRRSIPTYVGFSDRAFDDGNCNDGPSPHTWGFLDKNKLQTVESRSIPTYVGFSRFPVQRARRRTVHPHIRGVFEFSPASSYHVNGPSPHTWGFLFGRVLVICQRRSIPTYVGFSVVINTAPCSASGPSPHTWGFR